MFIRAIVFSLILAPNGNRAQFLDGSRSAPGDRGFSRRFENVPDLGFSLPVLRFVLYSCPLQRI